MEKEYKEYLLEMYVKDDSELIGKRIEDAELRNLKGVYLTGIIRENEIISPVKPSNVIVAGDILTFAGKIDTIDDLLEIKGLEIRPESHEYFDLLSKGKASFFEAVISLNSPLVDKTPKEINFRHQYNAVILAVNRQGERIVEKIGNIRFKPGDTLFIIADEDFSKQWERGKDFFYTTKKEGKIKPDKKSSFIVGAVFVAMILLAALNIKSLL
jgi:Trk K+ transport system NAD-binding subunit